MKSKMNLVVLLFVAVFTLEVHAGNKPVLDLNFKKYSPVGSKITGGEIVRIQGADALMFDKKRKRNFIHFNGRNDILEIALSDKARKALRRSFTLEFDFFSQRLPDDKNYRDPGICSIEVFSALSGQSRPALSFYINQYNRFTLCWFNSKGKRSEILTTWNHSNYELASIQRGKWYRVSIVYDHQRKLLEIYLDGEKLGATKTKGELKDVEQFRFGGKLKRTIKGRLVGGIENISLYSDVFNDKETDAIAQKKSWRRLYDQANNDLKSLLLPEDPAWADQHPRMILTPARIEVMKANLKKGVGPELVKKLVSRCDAMIDPHSLEYVKEIPVQAWGFATIMRPVELPLATILTGDKKYAERAIELVMDYTEKRGYYDVFNSLYASGEGMTRQMMVIAWTYDWAYQYFTPEQRQKVRLFFLNIAKGTYDFYNKEPQLASQVSALSTWATNWTAMSIATLGNSSLAIMGETKGLSKVWLDYAKFRAAQYGLFAIGENGCFFEMTHYFAYGAGPILPFMDALHTAGGDDLFMETNFSKYPNFLPYVMYPYSRKVMTLKYASTEVTGLHGSNSYVLAMLRQRLRNKQVEWCWQHIHADQPWEKKWNLFSLIWFEPEKEKVASPELPLAKWFKAEGVVGFRSDWTKDAIAGIFMAYPAKMGTHDQSDRGQFTLYGYQGRWIIDNGGRYKPQYSWRDAHNLITVDNKVPFQKARLQHNFHHDAFITAFCSADTIMTAVIADLTESYRYTYTWGHNKKCNFGKYEDPFKNATRELLYMREQTAPPYLLVYDTIQEDQKKHSYTLNLHTAPENEVKINKNQVEFKQYPSITRKNSAVTYLSWPGTKNASGGYTYTGKPYTGAPKLGYAEYKIKIPETDKYDLYGFGRPGIENPGGMDSFFIKLGKQKTAWGIPKYKWMKINKKPYELKKGEEVLTVLAREPRSKVMEFALYPVNAGIPIFNKPDNPKMIMIDAGKPDKLEKEFFVGTEKMADNAMEKVVAANMTLLQLSPGTGFTSEPFPGLGSSHIRLQTTTTAVRGQFLNFFYPRKPGMKQPVLKKLNKNASLITWQKCTDLICINSGKEIDAEGIKSDANLVLVRKKGDSTIAFVMLNGSFLSLNGKELIKLSGGEGIAGWSGNTLTVSGENVYNFTFHFPAEKRFFSNIFPSGRSLKNVMANGKSIKFTKVRDGWSAKMPFVGNKVLTW